MADNPLMLLLDPEIRLAIAYAPSAVRPPLALLWAFDERLAHIHGSARDPLIGEMRLAWWREAVEALDDAPPPGEPLLAAMAHVLLRAGLCGREVAAIEGGWSALFAASTTDDMMLAAHGRERGATLFRLAARLLSCDAASVDDLVGTAGEGWALVDLARNASDSQVRSRAIARARTHFGRIDGRRWPGALRPLGMIAALAARDAARGAEMERKGAPGRVMRMAWHRLTGR